MTTQQYEVLSSDTTFWPKKGDRIDEPALKQLKSDGAKIRTKEISVKQAKSIHIHGRRWFERVNGNTYHSVAIFVDGEHVHTTGVHYGYGSHYEQTAAEWLHANGYIPKDVYPLSLYCRDHWGIEFCNEVTDVARKKDL